MSFETPSVTPVRRKGPPPIPRGVERARPAVELEPEFVDEIAAHFNAVSQEEYEKQHPLGPECAPPEVVEKRAEIAQGLIAKIRKNPLFRPVWKAMAGLMGFAVISGAALKIKEGYDQSGRAEITQKLNENEENALHDPAFLQEFEKQLFDEVARTSPRSVESRLVEGDPSWTKGQLGRFQRLNTLEEKFEYLHRDDKKIIEAYKDPELRIRHYHDLARIASSEFARTEFLRRLTKQTIEDAPKVFAEIKDPAEAARLLAQLQRDMYESLGAKPVYILLTVLKQNLTPDHPLIAQIERSPLMSSRAKALFAPHKSNEVYFDQVDGTLMFARRFHGKLLKLDAFPANGGSPDAPAYGSVSGTHTPVRTPDGEFRFQKLENKKSKAWQNSWVANGSKLRFTEDGKDIDYLDADGKWKRFTGEDAEFFDGDKPFKLKEKSEIYRAATREVDGETVKPTPWTVKDVLAASDEMEYAMNDFGWKAARMVDARNGKPIGAYFHISPHDVAPEAKLEYSTGCIHIKPGAVKAFSDYLVPGARIRISSVLQSMDLPPAIPVG